jgi:hypothetical protein
MSKIMQRTTIIRSLAAAATAVAFAAVAATPASASPPNWPVDHPHITNTQVNFGSDLTNGAPAAGGNLHWGTDGATGVVTPSVSGRMYVLNSAGLRVRMRIDYYDAAGNDIDPPRHSAWQGPAVGNGMNIFSIVDLAPFGANNVYAVRVSTERETAAGDIQIIGSTYETI